MVNLNVNIGSLSLKNPVLTASGTFGYGIEFSDFIDLERLGGFIVKGTTLEPRQGNDYPRMAETPSGMLNAVGLQNKGVDYFIDHIYPEIRHLDSKIIVNVSGATPDDYAEVCRRIAERTSIEAVEINISCPNVKQGGMAFGTTTAGASQVTKAVRADSLCHLGGTGSRGAERHAPLLDIRTRDVYLDGLDRRALRDTTTHFSIIIGGSA